MALPKTARAFENELQALFHDWTHDLRSSVWKTRGARPQLNRAKVRKVISNLQDIAEEHLLHSKLTSTVLASYSHKKKWQVRGRGSAAKIKAFKEWYEEHVQTTNNVYVIMRRAKGQTLPLRWEDIGWKE